MRYLGLGLLVLSALVVEPAVPIHDGEAVADAIVDVHGPVNWSNCGGPGGILYRPTIYYGSEYDYEILWEYRPAGGSWTFGAYYYADGQASFELPPDASWDYVDIRITANELVWPYSSGSDTHYTNISC